MLSQLITDLDKVITEVSTKVTPHNIREGVTIFGITGSLPELTTQHKNVAPTKFDQLIVPDVGYNGLHEIVVHAVTSEIDSNIIPANIRSGYSILGVNGTLSNLTEDEYTQALLLEIDILGYTIYVYKQILVLNGSDYSVTNQTLTTTGTVTGQRLKLN